MWKTSNSATKKRATRTKKAKPKVARKEERKARADSKQSKLIALLKRREGATIAEVVEALEWQAHTVLFFDEASGS